MILYYWFFSLKQPLFVSSHFLQNYGPRIWTLNRQILRMQFFVVGAAIANTCGQQSRAHVKNTQWLCISYLKIYFVCVVSCSTQLTAVCVCMVVFSLQRVSHVCMCVQGLSKNPEHTYIHTILSINTHTLLCNSRFLIYIWMSANKNATTDPRHTCMYIHYYLILGFFFDTVLCRFIFMFKHFERLQSQNLNTHICTQRYAITHTHYHMTLSFFA